MFERIVPTEGDRDAEAALGRSPDQIAGLRLAAILILANVVLETAAALVVGAPVPAARVVIGCIVVYYLYRLRPRAETFAQGVAVIGAVATPLVFLLQKMPLGAAALVSVPAWGISAAVLMLLTGDPPKARRVGAVAIFVVFTVGFYLVMFLGALAGPRTAP